MNLTPQQLREYSLLPKKQDVPRRSTGIYQIFCSGNGKIYVGSSAKCFLKRWNWGHIWLLVRNKHHSRHMQRAWNKYGPASFEFSVLEFCQPELCVDREQHFMDLLQAANPAFGMNILPNTRSRLGVKLPPERLARMRAIMFGRTHSTETKAKMSAARRGRKQTPEHIAKRAAAKRGVKLSPEHRAKISAIKRTPEQRARMSASALARHAREKESFQPAEPDQPKQTRLPL